MLEIMEFSLFARGLGGLIMFITCVISSTLILLSIVICIIKSIKAKRNDSYYF